MQRFIFRSQLLYLSKIAIIIELLQWNYSNNFQNTEIDRNSQKLHPAALRPLKHYVSRFYRNKIFNNNFLIMLQKIQSSFDFKVSVSWVGLAQSELNLNQKFRGSI